ncbi:MAG: multidrug effflux MFS transporter [Bacteroidales bacterium]|nr:multidrug effflux MFS transporter [Bacteroidales bacterium]
MTSNNTSPSASAGKPGGLHGYLAFLAVYMACLSAFGSFVNDMYLPTLPELVKQFGCSVSTAQAGLTMGMIGLGVGEVILGPVSYVYGRKAVLVATVLLFIVGSLVCLLSKTMTFFLICRLIQGLGGAGGVFLGRAIPADVTQGRTLAKLMAVMGAISGVAPALAPVVGGFVADAWGWRGVFVTLAIIAGIILCFLPKLKESLPKESRQGKRVWASFANYLKLLRNRPYMIHVALKSTCLGLLFAYLSAGPFVLQDTYGFSESTFGLVYGGNAVLVAVGSIVALKFKPMKRAALFGAIMLLIATCAEAWAMWHVHSFWLFEALALPMTFAMGMIFTTSNTLAMNEGRLYAGGASALLGLGGYIAGGIVSPLCGIGKVLHASAICFVVLAALTLLAAIASYRLPADLDVPPKNEK